jgi:hypothetical protein
MHSVPRLIATVLVLGARASIPPEWKEDEAGSNLLYCASDVDVKPDYMPAIGNGYLGTQIGSDSIYVSGVYNGIGSETPSHRARIPSTVAFHAPGTVEHTAMNLREATYYRRSHIAPFKDAGSGFAPCNPWWSRTTEGSCTSGRSKAWVEQRWYAHRLLRSVLVHEVRETTAWDCRDDEWKRRRGGCWRFCSSHPPFDPPTPR